MVAQQGREACLDGRDVARLAEFFDPAQWPLLGVTARDDFDASKFTPKPWTEPAVIEQMRDDVAFGFEKALDQRGISSSLMHDVVKMWLWVLEDSLQHMDEYAQYGLPLFKAVAVKYGFDNPIGDDAGNELQYACGDYYQDYDYEPDNGYIDDTE